jgi:hypothetical protein
MPANGGLSTEAAKQIVIDRIAKGDTTDAALKAASRSRGTWENWRSSDPDFKAKVDKARGQKTKAASRNQDPANYGLTFAAWRKKFLNRETYSHQQMWIDLLEGREIQPHSAMTYDLARPSRVLLNTPPFHSKALKLDTPVLTPNGWSTIGTLKIGQQVYGLDGKPTTIIAKSEIFQKPCFRVTINTGETFVASEDHLWTIGKKDWTSGYKTMTTRELFERGDKFVRLPGHEALHMDAVDFILDPYVLGAWLGDGTTSDGGFTSADIEIVDEIRRHFEVTERTTAANKGRAKHYYIHGLFPLLAELGVKGKKFMPEGYMLGSYEQRLTLAE